MTRRLIVGKSSYGINELRNTVSLELYVRLTKVEAFGSLLRHAQRRAIVIMRLQVRETLDYEGCRPVDESQRWKTISLNQNNIAHRITSLARHLSAGCHRQETLTLRTGCRNQELRTNTHGISGSASIYLSHSTNFDSIRSTTLSLALDSFDKYFVKSIAQNH